MHPPSLLFSVSCASPTAPTPSRAHNDFTERDTEARHEAQERSACSSRLIGPLLSHTEIQGVHSFCFCDDHTEHNVAYTMQRCAATLQAVSHGETRQDCYHQCPPRCSPYTLHLSPPHYPPRPPPSSQHPTLPCQQARQWNCSARALGALVYFLQQVSTKTKQKQNEKKKNLPPSTSSVCCSSHFQKRKKTTTRKQKKASTWPPVP